VCGNQPSNAGRHLAVMPLDAINVPLNGKVIGHAGDSDDERPGCVIATSRSARPEVVGPGDVYMLTFRDDTPDAQEAEVRLLGQLAYDQLPSTPSNKLVAGADLTAGFPCDEFLV
jgi:hypothetical protein